MVGHEEAEAERGDVAADPGTVALTSRTGDGARTDASHILDIVNTRCSREKRLSLTPVFHKVHSARKCSAPGIASIAKMEEKRMPVGESTGLGATYL